MFLIYFWWMKLNKITFDGLTKKLLRHFFFTFKKKWCNNLIRCAFNFSFMLCKSRQFYFYFNWYEIIFYLLREIFAYLGWNLLVLWIEECVFLRNERHVQLKVNRLHFHVLQIQLVNQYRLMNVHQQLVVQFG